MAGAFEERDPLMIADAPNAPNPSGKIYDPTPEDPFGQLDMARVLAGYTVGEAIPGDDTLWALATDPAFRGMEGEQAAARLRELMAPQTAFEQDYPTETGLAQLGASAVPGLGAFGALSRASKWSDLVTSPYMAAVPAALAGGTAETIDQMYDNRDASLGDKMFNVSAATLPALAAPYAINTATSLAKMLGLTGRRAPDMPDLEVQGPQRPAVSRTGIPSMDPGTEGIKRGRNPYTPLEDPPADLIEAVRRRNPVEAVPRREVRPGVGGGPVGYQGPNDPLPSVLNNSFRNYDPKVDRPRVQSEIEASLREVTPWRGGRPPIAPEDTPEMGMLLSRGLPRDEFGRPVNPGKFDERLNRTLRRLNRVSRVGENVRKPEVSQRAFGRKGLLSGAGAAATYSSVVDGMLGKAEDTEQQ